MLAIVVSVLATGQTVYGQSSLILAQDRDGVSPRLLTPSEKAALGDPLFNLVLRDHAGETSLAAIQNLIQPDATKRQVFADPFFEFQVGVEFSNKEDDNDSARKAISYQMGLKRTENKGEREESWQQLT